MVYVFSKTDLGAGRERGVKVREAVHGTCLLALAAAYIGSNLFPSPSLKTASEVMAALTLFESLPLTRSTVRNISLALLGLGAVFSYISGATLPVWSAGFGQNAGLITIFVLVPQLAIPLRWERYTQALASFYRAYVNSKGRLALFSMLLTHFLGVILNVGSVAVVYSLVKDNLREDNERLVLSAINRGFAASIMWSPYFAAMALVLGKMQVQWSSVVGVGFPLAVLAMAGGYLIDYRQWAGNKSFDEGRPAFDPDSRAVILTMFFTGAGLTVAMLLLERLTGLTMIIIVSIVSTLFPILWSFQPGHKKAYREGMGNYLRVTLPLFRNEAVLFLSAGFFASAVTNGGAGKYILAVVQATAGHGALVLQLTILFTVTALAVFGLHPVVTISVLAASLAPPAGGVPAELLAVILLMSWAMANVSSPFTAVSMMLAGFSGRNSFVISLRWNIRYVIVTGLVLSVLLTLFKVAQIPI